MPLPDGSDDYTDVATEVGQQRAKTAQSATSATTDGTAPAAAQPSTDDYSDAAKEVGGWRDAALKNSLAIGAQQEPARAARIAQLSDELRLPPAVVERNFDEVSKAAHLSSIDTETLHRAHPELAQWLSDPVNAALAHKDIPNLQHADGAVAMVNQAAGIENDDPLPLLSGVIGRGARNAMRGLSMTLLAIPALVQQASRASEEQLLGKVDAPSRYSPLGQIYLAHDLMAAEAAARQTYAPSMLKDISTGVVTALSDPTNLVLPVAAGAKAAGAVPTILAATREAAALRAAALVQGELAGTSSLQQGLEAKQARGEGAAVGWRDVTNAAAQGALGFLTGRASGLIGPLATLRNQPMGLSQLPHDILANALLGGTQAQAGTVVSNAVLEGKATDLRDSLQSWLTGAVSGALISSGNLPEAAFVSRARALVAQTMQAHRAQADAAVLAQAGVATQTSETAKLAPDKYAELLKRFGKGADASVHFNQDDWTQHWEKTGGDPEAIADALAKKPGSFAEAKATGAHIVIPFSEYQAKLANTDHYEPLLEIAKLDPEGMTLKEANEFAKTSPEAVNQLVKTMIEEARATAPEHQASADALAKRMEDQLVAAGHDRGAAQTNAEAMAAMYQNLAKQVGRTPEEIAQRYPFDFSRELPAAPQSGDYSTLDAAIARVQTGDIPTQEDVKRSMQRIGADSGDVIDEIKSIGGIKARPAGNTGGEYEGRPNHPGINGNLAPDEVAKYLHDRGIGDGSVPTMYREIEQAARARSQAKELRHTPESQQLQAQRDYLLALAKELQDRGEDLTKSTSAEIAQKHGSTMEQPANLSGKGSSDSTGRPLAYTDKALKAFWRWFGKSQAVDGEGRPLVLYHGTTANFNTFNRERGNPESDFGRAFYFSNEPADVGANYAGTGPDLTNKIEQLSERIESEEGIDREEALKRAREQFMAHEGATVPVYLRLKKPVKLGGDEETRFTFDVNEDGEEKGTLPEFITALRDVTSKYHDVEIDEAISAVAEHALENGDIAASEVVKLLRADERFGYMTDDTGTLMNHEAVREAFEQMGFDGIIDRTVDEKFGSQRRVGRAMQGMNADTVHYLAFHPEQIKSALGNRGTFSAKDANILHQGATLEQPAFHGSPHEFDKFTTDKMGTGEGAQAYGWGLYFAGRKEVAKHYRENLSARYAVDKGAKAVREATGIDLYDLGGGTANDVYAVASDATLSVEAAARRLYARSASLRQFEPEATALGPHPTIAKMVEAVRALGKPGRLYHVEIPEDHEYLLWDKPLSAQPADVQKKIRELIVTRDMHGVDEHPAVQAMNKKIAEAHADRVIETRTGAEFYEWVSEQLAKPLVDNGWQSFVQTKNDHVANDEAASKLLLSAGIPGIKYLDGPSRAQGEGSHNYVVFDDSRIQITHYEQPGEKDPRAFIRINGRKFSIVLKPGADLTSVMHEAMHGFFEIMGDLAQDTNASPQLKSDYQTLLAFSGYGSHENKLAMQAEHAALQQKIAAEDRPATPEERARLKVLAQPHEDIAKSFEQYLMDGKAPNAEMRSVFARFKAWFALVYRKVGKLINLTPEVRGVFDRLIASEDQIKAAFVRAGDEPGLSREALGMTEAAHDSYLKAVADWRESAETSLRVELMSTYQREFTARYRDERSKLQEGVAQEVDSRPEFAALRALQDGIMPNGDVTPEGFKLNRRELVKRYGEDALYRLPGQQHTKRSNANTGRNVYAKDGTLYLGDAAELFGFKSGDELWHALVNAPNREQVIESETTAQMQKLHPDPMMDGSVASLADDAVHSDKRGELLVREMRALAKLAQKNTTPRQLMRVAALDTINGKALRDLQPHLYRSAEEKASRRTAEAAARGDHETALVEKQRQLLNHELFKAATEAKEAATKQVEHLNELSKPAARQRIGKAGGWEWTVRDPKGNTTLVDTEAKAQALAKSVPGTVFTRTSSYLDQLDGLLARFGLGRKTATSAGSMAAFIAKQTEHGGVAPEIPDGILDGSMTKDWRDLTVSELGAVFDAAKAIEAAARQHNAFLSDTRKGKLADLSGSLAESIKENGPAARLDRNGHTPFSKLTDAIGKIINFAKRAPDLCFRLDGFDYGAMFRGWQLPINKATDRETVRQAEATARVSAMWDRWGKLGPKSIFAFHLHQKEMIPEIGEGLNKFDQIMVAVNWGNAGNRERLMDGHKWKPEQVQAIIDRLDAKDVALVNEIHAHVNSFKSEIIALEQRVHGYAPQMVEATPFSGKGGEFTGGYFPIAYDNARSASKHVKNSDEQDITNMLAGRGAGSSYTAHQHTKERTASAGRPLNLDIGVFTNHLTKVIHDLELRETLIDSNRLLRSDAFTKAIEDHLGKGAWDQFEAQLRGVAGGNVRTNTGMEPTIGLMRQGANAARRSFNLAGSVKQLAGLPFIIPRVGLGNFTRALVPAFSPASHHWVEQNSVVMKFRNAERGKILNEELNRTSPFAPFGIFRDTAYFLYNKAWKLLDAHAWFATYYKAQAAGHSEQDARDIADQGVPDTQGATHQKDMAQMMRGGELAQVFTNNMSWASANFNMTALSIHRFLDRQGWKDGGEIAKLTSDMMVYLAVCPLVYAAVNEFMSGQDMSEWKDPKEVGKKALKEGAANVLSMMPLSREAAPFLTSDTHRWEGPQGTSSLGAVIAPLADTLRAAPKHPKPGPSHGERDLVNLTGILFHFPSAQVLHMIDGWNYAESQGLNPAWYTLMGKPPKQAKP